MIKRQELAVILVTVALLVIVGGAFALLFGQYSYWYTTEYSAIYLTSGKTKFFPSSDEVILGNVQFKVHNAWTLNSKYVVHVLPAGDNFYYQVDGRWHSYLDIDDLTPAFNVETNGSKFIIHAKGKKMQVVLSSLNNGKDVVIAADDVDDSVHFLLVVTTLDGKHSVSVPFRCVTYVDVGGIEIDPPSMVI